MLNRRDFFRVLAGAAAGAAIAKTLPAPPAPAPAPYNWDAPTFARLTYDRESGVSMRIVRAFDASEDRAMSRIDVLYGFAPVKGQGWCVIGDEAVTVLSG